MAVGFVELAAARQPDHLLGTKVIRQPTGHLVLAQVGVAIAVEQALFGGQQGALAIALDTAHFGDERRAITIETLDLENLLRDLIVLVPGVVKPAIEPAIGVELEVYAAYFGRLVMHQKGRAAVAEPGVVAGHFHHPHMRWQQASSVGVLRRRGANGDWLAAGDGRNDLDPDLLRRLAAVAPHVRALGPAEPAAALGFEFAGQTEAVGLG